MKTEGWVKIHRKILDSDLWLSEKFSKGQAWIDLVLLANHQKQSFFVRGNEVTIERGQVGWSEEKLAERWRWSRNRVRSFKNWLKKHNRINIRNSRILSIITILNYNDYQKKEQQIEQQTEQQKVQQKDTNKNVKNVKNEKNIIYNDSNQATTPKTINSIITLFKEVNPFYEKIYANKTQRKSLQNIIDKYGEEWTINLIKKLPEIMKIPTSPRITTPYELEKKMGHLKIFLEQEKNKKQKMGVSQL